MKAEDMDFEINYKIESPSEEIRTTQSIPGFVKENDQMPAANTWYNVQNANITSYDKFIGNARELSEPQKLFLLQMIGSRLLYWHFDREYHGNTLSQEEFFSKVQGLYIATSQNKTSEKKQEYQLGVCRHIHSYLEEISNDIGIQTAQVSVRERDGHSVTLGRTSQNNCFTLDFLNFIFTNTKSTKKALEAYQKLKGFTAFEHKFYENEKFQYFLITDDGEHFIEFCDFDTSTSKLKNKLIKKINDQKKLSFHEYFKDYVNAFKINYRGFFLKKGSIKGSKNSPLEQLNLIQTGYNNNFNPRERIDLCLSGSFLSGDLYQQSGDITKAGFKYDIGVILRNLKGFNIGNEFTGIVFSDENYIEEKTNTLINFHNINTGISYSHASLIGKIIPYYMVQWGRHPTGIHIKTERFIITEKTAGADLNLKKEKISIQPSFTKRPWEEEYKLATAISVNNFRINILTFRTNSLYHLCPEKQGILIKIKKSFNNLNLSAEYQDNTENYSSERISIESLQTKALINF